MKLRTPKHTGIAFAVMLLGGMSLTFAQTADLTITAFNTGTDGDQPDGCGFWYGSGSAAWDSTVDNTPDTAGSGSLHIQTIWGGSDTPLTEYICLPGDNYWWSGNGTFNLSEYKSLQFDIKWDPSSTVTLDQWNDPSTFPGGSLAGSTPGLEIDSADGNGSGAFLINTNIPAAAANGWVHITVPIDPSSPGIDPSVGFLFKKWLNGNATITGTNESGAYTNTANFWIDNVTLEGTAGPPPPPTVKVPTKAVQGLNAFANGAGLYDRQGAVLRQDYGLSWVGMASEANPVTYSFTIAGYPNSENCEAWMFLVPNPNYLDTAPDWNETNCVIVYVQGDASSATMHFQYKVNEDYQQAMYSGGNDGANYYTNAPGSWDGVTANYLESGNLGSVTNDGILGTWSVKFTSDTNLTLIAPNGNSTNLVLPSYNVGLFAEQGSPGFYVYLGMQPNNTDAQNQAVVYSDFAISGTGLPFTENFLGDTSLDTNIWITSQASSPSGIFLVPAGASSWISWTLPDSGFGLQVAPSLTDPLGWTSPTTGPIVAMNGIRSQLLMNDDLPTSGDAFFRLVKRSFTQLQVLWPGETNAPDTATGTIGTPDVASLSANNGIVPVTINAVDSTYHIVNVGNDTITATVSDPSGIWAADVQLSGGTAQGHVAFGTEGSWTITVSDTSNTNIPPVTSSTISVGP